jgi:sugar phosphate isomerase/epimerase
MLNPYRSITIVTRTLNQPAGCGRDSQSVTITRRFGWEDLMRFGCCVGMDGIESVEDAGYDYVELPVATVLPEASDAEWDQVRREILKYTIKPEAWYVLLPGDFRVTGPEVDWPRLRRYLATAFRRIAEVEGRVVVFGSGRARRVPDGFPFDEARKQIEDFVKAAGDAAHEKALRLAIEPLNRRESNMINSVAEALSHAAALSHPSVGVLADFFHMDEEHEPFADIIEARHYLTHVHIADTDRRHPGSGRYDYAGFFAALREAGYAGRMSVECVWGIDLDGERRAALEFLRGMDRRA